jgi:transposase InsO family protein
VRLQFIRPGKPIENAYIESFNGRFLEECLNETIFMYLDGMTPVEFAQHHAVMQNQADTNLSLVHEMG